MFIPNDSGEYDVTVGFAVDGAITVERGLDEAKARELEDEYAMLAADPDSEVLWVRVD